MELSADRFNELQQRVMLLEGGNTPYQVSLSNHLSEINTSLTTLTHNTATSIKSMRQELGLSIDGVEEVLTGDIQVVKSTIDERFDRLLDYLESWIGVGCVNMDDIKTVVGDAEHSSNSSGSSNSSTTPTTSTTAVSAATIKADVNKLKADVADLNRKMDTLLTYLETWANVGNLSMNDIKEVVN